MVLAALGVVAVALGGGSGTFASFNAQVSNNNNVFATGTLFLHQHSVGSDLCRSEDGPNNTNVDCTYNISKNLLPSDADPAVMQVAMTNAGTITPSSFNLNITCEQKTPAIGQTSTDHATDDASTLTTLGLASLSTAISVDTEIKVGSIVYNVTQDQAASASPVTLHVAWVSGSTGPNTGPASGTDVSFAAFGEDLCSNDMTFTVQETDSDYANPTCVWPSGTCTSGTTYASFHSSNGTGLALTNLAPGTTRYFKITVALPLSVGNAAQNAKSSVGFDWSIAQ